MRLFIAIELEGLSEYFRKLQELIPKAKATFPRQFHLTLKFLGDVDEASAEKMDKMLHMVKFRKFRISLDGLGVFPNENLIRVVWAGIKESKEIMGLQSQIDNALSGMFKKEERFHPHITLARIKFIEESRKKNFIDAVKKIKVEPKAAEISGFKLVRSTLSPEGPSYEDIKFYSAESPE